MVASERSAADDAPPAVAGEGVSAASSTLTLTLSSEALGALEAYLRSGAARGQAFEQALREALVGAPLAAVAPALEAPGPRCALSLRTLRKVHDFIAANLTRQFGIDDIARAAFLSPYHLGRNWHKVTGVSLWQYVLQSRARLACSLIESQPDATLADVATRSGFESYSQFISVFRRSYGITPSGFRRRWREAAQ